MGRGYTTEARWPARGLGIDLRLWKQLKDSAGRPLVCLSKTLITGGSS